MSRTQRASSLDGWTAGWTKDLLGGHLRGWTEEFLLSFWALKHS